MPATKTVQKRIRQADKSRMMNKHYRSLMRSKIRQILTITDKEEATKAIPGVVSTIDRTSSRGIIHKNQAGNQKSRIYRYVNSLD